MFDIDVLTLPPLSAAAGVVHLPGSKSISNRVLLLAALSQGQTVVHGLLNSDDTQVMLQALRQLGCGLLQHGSSVTVDGLGGTTKVASANLFMGNAGTAIRPLTAALALLGGSYELRGVARMHERPIADLVTALRQLGCQIDYLEQTGYPPLSIKPAKPCITGPIQVRGDVSSQFLTSLLLALPLLAARQNVVIEVTGELISRPYVEITLNLLARFGVVVQRQGWQRFVIHAGSCIRSPGVIEVEADASSASYFLALGAIAAQAPHSIRIDGLGQASIQGDIRFIDCLQAMGAAVASGPNWIEVRRHSWPLKAFDLDCDHIPDAAMTLALLALYADGPCTLRHIGSWRVKETDRIAAMACELRKLGASVQEGADWLGITPPASPASWRPASIATYDDHRMAMCFSLAAFNPARLALHIQDPKCVAKTFPDYFETLFTLVSTEREHIPVLCIDGPTASGKGTLAAALAKRLGYHFLDSGALYRVVALAAKQAGLALDADHEAQIASLAADLALDFVGAQVLLNGVDVSASMRLEETGLAASKVSALPQVRAALLDLQHSFLRLPGLVADGRDMGTVVFPAAQLKVFLTASVEKRAYRRYQQLLALGVSTKLDTLVAALQARDARDCSRGISPLKPAADAMLLDNSELSVEESLALVLRWWQGKQVFEFAKT